MFILVNKKYTSCRQITLHLVLLKNLIIKKNKIKFINLEILKPLKTNHLCCVVKCKFFYEDLHKLEKHKTRTSGLNKKVSKFEK